MHIRDGDWPTVEPEKAFAERRRGAAGDRSAEALPASIKTALRDARGAKASRTRTTPRAYL